MDADSDCYSRTGKVLARSEFGESHRAGRNASFSTDDRFCDSSKQKSGYKFTAALEANLQAYDVTVAPKGTTLYGVLAQASSSGKFKGSSQLILELTDIVINGTAYPLMTSDYEVKGKGEGGNTAKKVVGGAGLGALIGGIAGGGKGAGIGALVGGGAGTAVAASKKGEQISVPSETLLEFRLEHPTELPIAK